ncbi:MAG TPA: cytosine permease [Candidatus Lumbricidophila sp.]|nr:cytosine permease [Candidatus Lumbricidophila sp.]
MSTLTTEKPEQYVSAAQIEDETIRPIPVTDRHGKSRDLFTIFFGTNIMILSIVTGGLATAVFGQSLFFGAMAIIVGNLIGAIFMALHAAQGPRLGVPQMVQTRGQFGSYGSVLIILVVIVMYLGWFTSILAYAADSLATIIPGLPVPVGVVLLAVLSATAAIFGYRLIHAYAKVISIVSLIALIVTVFLLIFVHPVPAGFWSGALDLDGNLAAGDFNLAGFMFTLSAAACWQIAYAPYVSDYSRYMPAATGSKPAFWASYWGTNAGSILAMLLGAGLGLAVAGGDVVANLTAVAGPLAVPVVVIFTLGIAATNAMNIYCGTLCTLTIGQTFADKWKPKAGTRAVVAAILATLCAVLAIVFHADLNTNYINFILLLLGALVPWTAVNLVDYYLVRHGDYQVDEFFRRDGGRYGYVNWAAVVCYVIGVAVQIPFINSLVFVGPIGGSLGFDISWLIGLLVTSPLYYLVAKAFPNRVTA